MVEDAELTRARKDLERAFPRATVPEVSERKRGDLPDSGFDSPAAEFTSAQGALGQ